VTDVSSMQIKRAETRDIPAIKQLIKGGFGRDDMEKALKRRYGETPNLHKLM
jgi:N-acetylglutamate synthase-like GNAT family acetyltransferase